MKPSDMSEATRALLPLLDPLSAADEHRAIESAQHHLRDELSQRYRLFPPVVRISKPKNPGDKSRRTIVVLIVDYERRKTLEVTVGNDGTVERIDDLGAYQPPFLLDEIKEAREIAERTGGFGPLLQRTGIFVQPFVPERPQAQGGRRVGLRYRAPEEDGSASVLLEAVVNLSDRRLTRFEEFGKPERQAL
jgi:hypothetical protein